MRDDGVITDEVSDWSPRFYAQDLDLAVIVGVLASVSNIPSQFSQSVRNLFDCELADGVVQSSLETAFAKLELSEIDLPELAQSFRKKLGFSYASFVSMFVSFISAPTCASTAGSGQVETKEAPSTPARGSHSSSPFCSAPRRASESHVSAELVDHLCFLRMVAKHLEVGFRLHLWNGVIDFPGSKGVSNKFCLVHTGGTYRLEIKAACLISRQRDAQAISGIVSRLCDRLDGVIGHCILLSGAAGWSSENPFMVEKFLTNLALAHERKESDTPRLTPQMSTREFLSFENEPQDMVNLSFFERDPNLYCLSLTEYYIPRLIELNQARVPPPLKGWAKLKGSPEGLATKLEELTSFEIQERKITMLSDPTSEAEKLCTLFAQTNDIAGHQSNIEAWLVDEVIKDRVIDGFLDLLADSCRLLEDWLLYLSQLVLQDFFANRESDPAEARQTLSERLQDINSIFCHGLGFDRDTLKRIFDRSAVRMFGQYVLLLAAYTSTPRQNLLTTVEADLGCLTIFCTRECLSGQLDVLKIFLRTEDTVEFSDTLTKLLEAVQAAEKDVSSTKRGLIDLRARPKTFENVVVSFATPHPVEQVVKCQVRAVSPDTLLQISIATNLATCQVTEISEGDGVTYCIDRSFESLEFVATSKAKTSPKWIGGLKKRQLIQAMITQRYIGMEEDEKTFMDIAIYQQQVSSFPPSLVLTCSFHYSERLLKPTIEKKTTFVGLLSSLITGEPSRKLAPTWTDPERSAYSLRNVDMEFRSILDKWQLGVPFYARREITEAANGLQATLCALKDLYNMEPLRLANFHLFQRWTWVRDHMHIGLVKTTNDCGNSSISMGLAAEYFQRGPAKVCTVGFINCGPSGVKLQLFVKWNGRIFPLAESKPLTCCFSVLGLDKQDKRYQSPVEIAASLRRVLESAPWNEQAVADFFKRENIKNTATELFAFVTGPFRDNWESCKDGKLRKGMEVAVKEVFEAVFEEAGTYCKSAVSIIDPKWDNFFLEETRAGQLELVALQTMYRSIGSIRKTTQFNACEVVASLNIGVRSSRWVTSNLEAKHEVIKVNCGTRAPELVQSLSPAIVMHYAQHPAHIARWLNVLEQSVRNCKTPTIALKSGCLHTLQDRVQDQYPLLRQHICQKPPSLHSPQASERMEGKVVEGDSKHQQLEQSVSRLCAEAEKTCFVETSQLAQFLLAEIDRNAQRVVFKSFIPEKILPTGKR